MFCEQILWSILLDRRKLQSSASHFLTCSLLSLVNFQAEQLKNTTWSSIKNTTPNFVIYTYHSDNISIEEIKKLRAKRVKDQ